MRNLRERLVPYIPHSNYRVSSRRLCCPERCVYIEWAPGTSHVLIGLFVLWRPFGMQTCYWARIYFPDRSVGGWVVARADLPPALRAARAMGITMRPQDRRGGALFRRALIGGRFATDNFPSLSVPAGILYTGAHEPRFLGRKILKK